MHMPFTYEERCWILDLGCWLKPASARLWANIQHPTSNIGFICFLLLATSALAQIPERDARNGELPDGRNHFQMSVYKTLAEWEARAAHLRKQILTAAGLDPLPQRTPLNSEIFGRLERQGYSIEKVL